MKKAWETNLQLCSLKMMQVLSDQYNTDIRELDKEILKWQEDHANLVSHACFQDKDKTKEGKFTRDTKAYEYEKAY